MEKTPRQIATEAAEAIRDEAYYLLSAVQIKTLATEYLRLVEGPSKGGKADTPAQNAARAANGKKGGRPRKKSQKPVDKPEYSG